MDNNTIIFVVDDDQEVTSSLKWLIESIGYQVQVYSDARDFLSEYADQPGCLVLDVRMPELTGLELQDLLDARGINIPIIFITAHGDVSMAVRAMKNNAVDFLTKPVNNQILIEAINQAVRLDGKQRVQRAKLLKLTSLKAELTPRELEVMDLMVQGHSTKVIAQTLGISPNTAELHRARVMKKMQVKSLAELVGLVLTVKQDNSVAAS